MQLQRTNSAHPRFGSPSDPSSSREKGLRGSWLILARVVWFIITIPALGIFVASIPSYFAALRTPLAPGVSLSIGRLSLADIHALQALGISIDLYAVCLVGASVVLHISYVLVGLMVFRRKSTSFLGLLVSFALMLFPFGFASLTLQGLPPTLSWLIPLLIVLSDISMMLCAYVFPDGRFVPGWTRWVSLLLAAYWIAEEFAPAWAIALPWLSYALLLALIGSTMLAQVYRYCYVSDEEQRRQTRWLLFGLSIAVVSNIGIRLFQYFILFSLLGGNSLIAALCVFLMIGSMLVIPAFFALAVFRARLWDIDLLINRTLVYGTLTALLVGVYGICVFALHALLGIFIGQIQRDQISFVASVLAIAALFQPLRLRVQRYIDRRFYRQKYDAALTLEALGETLREEVDLCQLKQRLVSVVQETMEPETILLWINDDSVPVTDPGHLKTRRLVEYFNLPEEEYRQSRPE